MNYPEIDSKNNPKIKHISRLLSDKAYRISCGETVIENAVMLMEAMSCNITVKAVFCDASAVTRENETLAVCDAAQIPVFAVEHELMPKLSALETPQGLTAVIESQSLPKPVLKSGGRYVMLERVSDPGNVGTVIRSADAFGFDGVILSEGCTDAFSPKAMRATMGSIFRMPVLTGADIPEIAAELKKNGITVLAAVLDREARPLQEMPRDGGVAVMIGNEASGLSQEAVLSADRKVFIAMKGKAESLNAAVAASVFMYHFGN